MRILIGVVLVVTGLSLLPSQATYLDMPSFLLGHHYNVGRSKAEAIANVRQALLANMKDASDVEIERLSTLIVHLARECRIPESLILSIIKVESGFQPLARSPRGAIGLMQLMPETGEWLAQRFGVRWAGSETLNSSETNVYLGVKYLFWLKEKYKNDLQLMLSAYNRGPAKVDEELLAGQPMTLSYYYKIKQVRGGGADVN